VTDRRPPESLGGDETEARLPYSKGLMAKTLAGTGIRPERAYELARLIEQELVRERQEDSYTEAHLFEVAEQVVASNEGEEAVRGLRRYRRLQELELPLILLVGGATGTGKSTVTTEVAHRLGITRVASTDFVRQTMRAFFSEGFMPSIHYSSFEAAAALASPEEARDPTIVGFNDQTRNVLVGVRAVIDRAMTESYSVALEGVHIVPGLVPAEQEGAVVVQVILTIDDAEEHAQHFWVRDAVSEGVRPVDKYLDALGEIRRIQAYLVERAERAAVPVIENSRIDRTVEAIIRLVLEEVERAVGAPAPA
jgi:2-phosphoglycerate kinase